MQFDKHLVHFTHYSELKKAQSDLEAVRKQAEGTNREYDRLLKEHAKLQV